MTISLMKSKCEIQNVNVETKRARNRSAQRVCLAGLLATIALNFLIGIQRERPAGTREALPGTKSKEIRRPIIAEIRRTPKLICYDARFAPAIDSAFYP
jgi:hypothetical protein